MGSRCGKIDPSPRDMTDSGETGKVLSTSDSVTLETFTVPTRQLIHHRIQMIKACKSIVAVKIIVGDDQNIAFSQLSGVLRLPTINWGHFDVMYQVPKLLPMNVWKGDVYVFGLLNTDSVEQSRVTLTGKLGKEDLYLEQSVEIDRQLPLDVLPTLTSIIDDELLKQNWSNMHDDLGVLACPNEV